MTLRELIAEHPDRFYAQTWYQGHAFMERTVPPPVSQVAPTGVRVSSTGDGAHTHAAALAVAYLADPANLVWRRCLWTCDTDDLGQQIYVCDNGHGLELHRHLHISPRFGLPTWN